LKVIYSNMDFPKNDILKNSNSIFLCGPTPRDSDTKSWRIEALEILNDLNYPGIVLIPERQDWKIKFDYVDQVDWELSGLRYAKQIVFWIPREMNKMPALTSNVEFGMTIMTRKNILYGRPENAEKCRYLDHLYNKFIISCNPNLKIQDNLISLLSKIEIYNA